MSATYLLDASAVLALARREPGGDKVADLLDHSRIHAVNLGEVVRVLNGKGMPAEEVEGHLRALSLDVIEEINEDEVYSLGKWTIEAKQLGLSLGDCICLAAASKYGLIPVTTDRKWGLLTRNGPPALLIR
jgi:PIN domain nuclease of toxin-antitoxin system